MDELADELLALTASTDAPIITDPLSVEAAMHTPQAAQWQAAMQAEIDSLHAAGTYELAPLPTRTSRHRLQVGAQGQAQRCRGGRQVQGASRRQRLRPALWRRLRGNIRAGLSHRLHSRAHRTRRALRLGDPPHGRHVGVSQRRLGGDRLHAAAADIRGNRRSSRSRLQAQEELVWTQASRSHMESQDRRTAPRIRLHRA